MKLHYIALGLGLISMPAMANIASSGYVDSVKSGLETDMSNKLSNTFEGKGMALTTNNSGVVGTSKIGTDMIDTNAVTNNNVASGIGINKLALPTGKCTTGSCILIYNADSQTYTWEPIGRADSGDTAPTGGVDGSGSSN